MKKIMVLLLSVLILAGAIMPATANSITATTTTTDKNETTTTTTTDPYANEVTITKYTTTTVDPEADSETTTTTTTPEQAAAQKAQKDYNEYVFNDLDYYKAVKYQYDDDTIYKYVTYCEEKEGKMVRSLKRINDSEIMKTLDKFIFEHQKDSFDHIFLDLLNFFLCHIYC